MSQNLRQNFWTILAIVLPLLATQGLAYWSNSTVRAVEFQTIKDEIDSVKAELHIVCQFYDTQFSDLKKADEKTLNLLRQHMGYGRSEKD